MGPDIVEGYLIHPDKPWCLPFATSEIDFTRKVSQFEIEWAPLVWIDAAIDSASGEAKYEIAEEDKEKIKFYKQQ